MSSSLEAVVLLEVASIARGFVVLDQLAKRAAVVVRQARAVTPGKFIILFAGEVASVQESLEAAREAAGSLLLDELYLPAAHASLLPALEGHIAPAAGDAVGIVETETVASSLLAADAALKACEVSVLKMQLALGIGGKGYFTLAGALGDVEAALDAARAIVEPSRIVGIEIIPQPMREIRGFFS